MAVGLAMRSGGVRMYIIDIRMGVPQPKPSPSRNAIAPSAYGLVKNGSNTNAKAAVSKAELELERVSQLAKTDVASKEAQDNARLALDAARAAQREAERIRIKQEAKQKALDEFAPERAKLEAFLSQFSAVTLPTFTSEIGQQASRDLSGMKAQFETAVKHYISKL